MKRCIGPGVGLLALAGVLVLAAHADAATSELTLKKLGAARAASREEAMILQSVAYARAQTFFMSLGPTARPRPARPGEAATPPFSDVIQKEPAYASEHPFRGVAKLGSDYFGFVFDGDPPAAETTETPEPPETKPNDSKEAKEAEKPAAKTAVAAKSPYTRLYFDLNHNGDLTDDKVVGAVPGPARLSRATAYFNAAFPTLDVEFTVDGKKMDYAFRMRVGGRLGDAKNPTSYANASLVSAAFRQGTLELDGKEYLVALVDANSNGRFDDPMRVSAVQSKEPRPVRSIQGDTLYVIDPERKTDNISPYDSASNDFARYIGPVVLIGDSFHKMTVTPAGDRLSVEPEKLPAGFVTNPLGDYQAVVYGPNGVQMAIADASGKASLPVGEWKLLAYSARRLEMPTAEEAARMEAAMKARAQRTPERKGQEGQKKDGQARKAPPGAVRPVRPLVTSIRANAMNDYKAITVVESETVDLPFGGPYRPVVTIGDRPTAAKGRPNEKTVPLTLSLIGVAGERVSSLTVKSNRPKPPTFTITGPDGKEVGGGAFEYG